VNGTCTRHLWDAMVSDWCEAELEIATYYKDRHRSDQYHGYFLSYDRKAYSPWGIWSRYSQLKLSVKASLVAKITEYILFLLLGLSRNIIAKSPPSFFLHSFERGVSMNCCTYDLS